MTDPIAPLIYVSAIGGITIAGMVTGLDPALLFAGACGGYWALMYMGQQSFLARTNQIIMSSLIAAWASPAVTGWALQKGFISAKVGDAVWHYLAALLIGLIAVPVLGKGIMRLAKRKLDGVPS